MDYAYSECAFVVVTHQPSVANNLSGEDVGELALVALLSYVVRLFQKKKHAKFQGWQRKGSSEPDCLLWVKSYRLRHLRSTSEAGGEPDVIGPKADIDTHAGWLAERNWPTLSRIGGAQGRSGAISGRKTPKCPRR